MLLHLDQLGVQITNEITNADTTQATKHGTTFCALVSNVEIRYGALPCLRVRHHGHVMKK